MIRILNASLCLGLMLGLFTLQSQAEDASKTRPKMVNLGAEDSWPPYSDQYGKGISTNIVIAAFKKMGFTTQIQVRPYARVLHDVKTGVLEGGYNVARQKSTETEFVFGMEPILTATSYWYFPPSGTTASPRYQSLDRLPEGTRVGGIIDYEYGDEYEAMRHKFREVRVPRQSQLVKMLQQGRIDAAIMFEEEANQTLKSMGLPETAIEKGFFNHTSNIYVAFSLQNKRSEELAKTLDLGIIQLKASGEYELLLHNSY